MDEQALRGLIAQVKVGELRGGGAAWIHDDNADALARGATFHTLP